MEVTRVFICSGEKGTIIATGEGGNTWGSNKLDRVHTAQDTLSTYRMGYQITGMP